MRTVCCWSLSPQDGELAPEQAALAVVPAEPLETHYPLPVRLLDGLCDRVTLGDRGLDAVRTEPAAYGAAWAKAARRRRVAGLVGSDA